MKRILVRSAVRCLVCGVVIESKHRRDYVKCECPSDSDTSVTIDGGLLYQKIGYGIRSEFEDISEWEEYEK